MKRLTQHWRGVLRVLSLLLACIGIFCGYWWFYKFAPARRTLDPDWYNTHSQRDYWREVQKGIRRGMWQHDDGFTVGKYGDKSWAEWIMAHVTPGTSMGCLGGQPCHSATAMRYITNQDAGEEADAWLKWWAENKSKSQLDWIEEGFRECGYDIDVPPVKEQISTFLTILGGSENEDGISFSDALEYNAFRCLRDSGFEPIAFVISNPKPSSEVERGLLAYASMERRWPPTDRLGILPFEDIHADDERVFLPLMLTPRFEVMANILVFGPLLLGVPMWIYSYRAKGGPSVTSVLVGSVVAGAIAIAAVLVLRLLF